MTLQFLIGRSGTGKTSVILDEIRGELKENPAGSPLIYLVPEQMTFLSEYKLVKTPGLGGMIRAQVFSFSRLAFRVLQETGGMTRRHLDSAGVNMLIRKIMDEKKDELKMFRRSSDKPGFAAQMEEMLQEFKRYCIDPSDLSAYSSGETADGLKDKLHDLELIYSRFQTELIGKYLDSEDYFTLLIEKMASSPYIASSRIYLDGFYSLTPQELLVVEELMKQSRGVTAALTLDRPYRQAPPGPLELFRQTGSTYHELYSSALRWKIPVEPDRILKGNSRFQDAGLSHLERNFAVRPAEVFTGGAGVTVARAVNRRAEIEGTARQILALVRDGNHRFRDIAILLRNGEAYHELIQTVFKDYRIPVFIDAKRTMLNHPLIELVRSTLEVLMTNWRYEPVFRAVKTDLLSPIGQTAASMRERIDRFENYVLSRGLKGRRWTSGERWGYRKIRGLELEERAQTTNEKELEDELNELRELFTKPILTLAGRLKRAAGSREYCEALYLYLEELHIPEKLDKLKLEAEDRGDLTAAGEHEQAWEAVIGLLDQFVEMAGDDPVTLKQFAELLETGMESMKFSLVPPAIDQVMIANLDLSRIDDVRTAFVIGLNEGVLPGRPQGGGIFSDRERESMLADGFPLAPGSSLKLIDEEFTAYKAFTTPAEKLFLSYPIADEEGKTLLPSPYIKRVSELFGNAGQLVYMNDPADLDPESQAGFAANYDVALSHLTAQMQLQKRGYPMHPLWWDVYGAYMDDPLQRPRAMKVLSSLYYENKPKKLSGETAKELYGENIHASVSRMEMFNSCPFSHFAAHGLKLQERKIFRLDAPDIGEMFHGALKIISDYLYEHQIPWSSLTKEQCLNLAKRAVDMLAPKLQNEILLSTNRHHYLKKKLEDVIGRASVVLSEQAKASGFAPIGLEVAFGKNGEIPPLTFELKNGTTMELVGRIDRVDKAEEGDGVYLRVLDYKSSDRELNIGEVYYGLALQMLTYLDIVISHSRKLVGKDADPAGVLYFHVHNPLVKSSGKLSMDELEQAVFKSFKMKGLILGDQNVARMMDVTLDPAGKTKSDIVPISLKKDGSMDARSKIASREEFSLLQNHVRKVYQEAGDAIVGGTVDIKPYKLKDRVPCTFCPYKSVCQFDQSLEENEYEVLSVKKDAEIMDLLRKGGEGHE